MLAKRTSISPIRVIKSDSLVERSLDLLRRGIIFGWKRELYIGAGLYNLKLHSPNFLSVCKDLSIADTTRKRYLRVGKRISEIISSSVDNDRSFISEEDIESLFTSVIHNGERLTLRGLDKASCNLSTFTSYLKGEFVDVTENKPISHESLPKLSEVREFEEVSTWDTIERSLSDMRSTLANVLGRKAPSEDDTNDFLKYKSVMHTLEQIRLAVSAYHRGDVEEVHELLSSTDFELV